MAKGDYSLDDPRLLRDVFANCIKDLIENTDFDVMYDKLNNTDAGKNRMSYIFVLRAYSGGEIDGRSSLLYNAIRKEKDEDFVHWFDAITSALRQTGNENNGKHQEVLEKISDELQEKLQERRLQDSKNKLMMSSRVRRYSYMTYKHVD